jgi:hypothetical protein
VCKVCDHPNRSKIEAAIVCGTRYSTIFHRWIKTGNEESWIQAFKDHKRNNHITDKIKKANESQLISEGLNLQMCAQEIYALCLRAGKRAEEKDPRAIGSILSPAVKVLELLNKGDESKPQEAAKESGFSAAYLKRAKEVYAPTQAKDQGPPI